MEESYAASTLKMEKFIALVKEYPCLWDYSSLLFNHPRKKDEAWRQVAKQCNVSGPKEASNVWKRLRNCHREALRRRRVGTQKMKPWKYERAMEFLLYSGNDPSVEVNVEPDIDQECSEYEDVQLNDISIEDDPIRTEYGEVEIKRCKIKSREEFTDQENEPVMEMEQPCCTKTVRTENKKRPKVMPVRYRGKRTDSLTDLFSSLCKKTRVLPMHLQLRVQREVFDSVSRAEAEACGFNSSSLNAPSSSNSYDMVFKMSPTSDFEGEVVGSH